MRRLALVPWLCALPLAGLAACGVFKASAPACIHDSGVACSAAYCDLVRTACAKNARLCDKPSGECDVEVCARDVAGKLATFPQPDKTARDFYECVTRQTSCVDVTSCFDALGKNERCAKEAQARKSDLVPVLPTRVAQQSAGVAGVVVLPGDDLQCLQCALQPGGCAESSPECFSAAPSTAGATDTCLDYRACLRTCEQTSGDDAIRYATCAAQYCDGAEHAHGKPAFAEYRACMFDRCAACFSSGP
jgi:hypothetical protein